MFNQDTKLLKKILLLWVNLSIKKEFVVTHEMTISVKNVENIGYLVDKILSKSGITLQTFEWKAL